MSAENDEAVVIAGPWKARPIPSLPLISTSEEPVVVEAKVEMNPFALAAILFAALAILFGVVDDSPPGFALGLGGMASLLAGATLGWHLRKPPSS